MQACKSEQEYIEKVAPAAQRACKRYGYLPSVLIAQSCLENGYAIPTYADNDGVRLLVKYNNMVGMKSSLLTSSWVKYSVWPGEEFTKLTPEEYNGHKVVITDKFRIYDSVEQSFCDFILFLLYASNDGPGGKPKYGHAVVDLKDPAALIEAVRSRGYATDSAYSRSVMKIVNKHGLTRYDDLTGVQSTDCIPVALKGKETEQPAATKSGEVSGKANVKKLSDRSIIDITARNRSQIPASRGGNEIKFLVVHYLGVANTDNPDLYGGGYGGHYNIKRDGTVYCAADPKSAVVWQCGGDLQGSGGHQFFKICTNYNSIGIECGVCYTESGVKDPDDESPKWYFTEETQESLVWLVSMLMDKYSVPFDHVIRHYDVTGKICPNPYVLNCKTRTSWTWNEFKSNLKQYRKDGTITLYNGADPTPAPEPTPTPVSVTLKKGDRGDAVKTMQTMLIACGFSCGAAGADGIFGSGTNEALRSFQSAAGLSVDGIYGIKSKTALELCYEATKAPVKVSARKVMTAAVKRVADMARENHWTYGDSHSEVPCEDGKISCDRLIARALYNIGFRDQRAGGETCGTLNAFLTFHGWTKATKRSEIKAGAVVAVRKKGSRSIDHVFFVASYNEKTDTCTKYDTGSDERIRTKQPFKNVKLVEWKDREFVCAWNCPSWLGSGTPGRFRLEDIDYSPVFNAVYYSRMNEDVKKACGTDRQKLFKHFCEHGMAEGRQGCAGFNVQTYMENNPDLKAAFGNDLAEYYAHYCAYGRNENRDTI